MSELREGLRWTGWLLLAGMLGILALLWPQSLHGSVAYVRVDGHSMDPTFHMGDLAVVRRQASYRIGDPVAYRIPKGEFGAGALVIHRLIGGDGVHGFVTRGDNRDQNDEWHPRTADVVGRVRYVVPGAGSQLATLTKPVYLGALVAGVTVLVMVIPSAPRRREELVPPYDESSPVGSSSPDGADRNPLMITGAAGLPQEQT